MPRLSILKRSISLRNGSNSPNLNVNGASVNQEFYFSPVDKTVLLSGLDLLINDSGTNGLGNFGARSILSNGISIDVILNNITHNIMLLKTNSNILNFFDLIKTSTGQSGLTGTDGFGASTNWAKATYSFHEPLVMNSSDRVRALVRDDLSGIGTLTLSCDILEEY